MKRTREKRYFRNRFLFDLVKCHQFRGFKRTISHWMEGTGSMVQLSNHSFSVLSEIKRQGVYCARPKLGLGYCACMVWVPSIIVCHWTETAQSSFLLICGVYDIVFRRRRCVVSTHPGPRSFEYPPNIQLVVLPNRWFPNRKSCCRLGISAPMYQIPPQHRKTIWKTKKCKAILWVM